MRAEIERQIVSMAAHGGFQRRQLYLWICQSLVHQVNQNLFDTKSLPLILNMHNDKVPNVRLSLVQLLRELLQHKTYAFHQVLLDQLEKLTKDKDEDVSTTATVIWRAIQTASIIIQKEIQSDSQDIEKQEEREEKRALSEVKLEKKLNPAPLVKMDSFEQVRLDDFVAESKGEELEIDEIINQHKEELHSNTLEEIFDNEEFITSENSEDNNPQTEVKPFTSMEINSTNTINGNEQEIKGVETTVELSDAMEQMKEDNGPQESTRKDVANNIPTTIISDQVEM